MMDTDKKNSEVRVRIAPSPTGAMHLGLARTALYNWLFARHHGGRFVLRIDDTDQERNLDDVLEPILHGLRWLGIDWDEGPEVGGPHAPYFQSQRVDRHRAVVDELLECGCAYRDYATLEELKAEREAALAAKGSLRNSRRWMAESAEDRARFEREGRKSIVRLKMPDAGTLVVDDMVRGKVEFDWALEQDHAIQRADGSCLYHLTSAVDDHDFGITHVIRAEEHLSNTPRQIFISRSLGWDLPRYAHLPFVAEPGSRNKLSKRKLKKYLKDRDFAELVEHGRRIAARLGVDADSDAFNPVTVDFYEKVGFLPEALVNYLVLLGWALDDKTEHFTREELVRVFSLDRVNRAPASFDPHKLMAFQVRHMLARSVEQRVTMFVPCLQQAGLVSDPPGSGAAERVARIVEAAGDRIKVAGDILDYADFFVPDSELACDEKAFAKRVRKPGAADLLGRFRDRLAAIDRFDVPALEESMRGFIESEDIKIGQVIHALRVAVTGKGVGFGMFDTLAILGRESCLARIDRALDKVNSE
jgi:glutamyl-tRNA synthetase